MIKTKAEEFASKLGKAEFKVRDEWLTNWKKRNEVTHKTECGESGRIDPESAANPAKLDSEDVGELIELLFMIRTLQYLRLCDIWVHTQNVCLSSDQPT